MQLSAQAVQVATLGLYMT